MRVLFDHGTPSGIPKALSGHHVTEAIERGWDRISNGELLELAEAEGFELLLTTDKRIRYQQNSHCGPPRLMTREPMGESLMAKDPIVDQVRRIVGPPTNPSPCAKEEVDLLIGRSYVGR